MLGSDVSGISRGYLDIESSNTGFIGMELIFFPITVNMTFTFPEG